MAQATAPILDSTLTDLINGNPAYRRKGVRIEKAFGLAR
jgi:hypothetical protein